MFCENCGNEIKDDARFCPVCGARVNSTAAPVGSAPAVAEGYQASSTPQEMNRGYQAAPMPKEMNRGYQEIGSREDIQGQRVTENIYLCPDGAYRWVYEFDMIKNPTILITVWKVLLMSFAIVIFIMLFFTIIEDGLDDIPDLIGFFGGFVLIMLFMAALSAVAYFIVAMSYGLKYMVLFTMDENQIEHRQMKNQFDKAKAMGWLSAAAGLATGSIGRAAPGILAATKTASTSVFGNVKKVKSDRRHNVIYVNETLEHNQIYVDDADFDFVRNYIIERCRNAKHVS